MQLISVEDDPYPRRVEEYLDETLLPEDAVLQIIRCNAQKAMFPPIEVSPQQGKLLTLLTRVTKAQRVLEIGTLAGYSTMCLARGMLPGGTIATLESVPEHAALAREHFTDFPHPGVTIRVLEGDALLTLPRLDFGFDFVFIDADKENNAAYVDWAARLCQPGSLIVVDNVIRSGRILTITDKRKFIRSLADNPKIVATVIQTLSSKGWDGFAFSYVR